MCVPIFTKLNVYKENMIYLNSYTSFTCVKLISEAKLKISRKNVDNVSKLL